jgi:hypothetical protein
LLDATVDYRNQMTVRTVADKKIKWKSLDPEREADKAKAVSAR